MPDNDDKLPKGEFLVYQGKGLHSPVQVRLEGETVWLRFLEFADQTPIAATVRWSQRWGVSRCIPGAGLRFETLTARQEKELQLILNP